VGVSGNGLRFVRLAIREVPNLGTRHVTGAIILRGRLILCEAYLAVGQGTDWPLPQRTLPNSQRIAAQISLVSEEIRRRQGLVISER
jgi:hypothetical protein